jgi:hypothetical protein
MFSRAPEISSWDEGVLKHLLFCLAGPWPDDPFCLGARVEREFAGSDVEPHVAWKTKICRWLALSAELEVVDLQAVVTYDLVREAIWQRLDGKMAAFVSE